LVGHDRENNHVRVVVRFDSEEKLRTGSETLEGMEPPPEANLRRISVEKFEVLLERHALAARPASRTQGTPKKWKGPVSGPSE
jgi:hypothetical protein